MMVSHVKRQAEKQLSCQIPWNNFL